MSYGAAGSVPLANGRRQGRWRRNSHRWASTVDFAPDADVTIGPADPTIGARSMSGDPGRGGKPGRRRSPRGMLAAGVLPAVKHFPGHGSVTVDSHQDLPVQKATRRRSSRPGTGSPSRRPSPPVCPMIMTGHIAVPALEPGVPASLSPAELRGAARHGLQGSGRDGRPEHGGGAASSTRAARPPRLRSPQARTCC